MRYSNLKDTMAESVKNAAAITPCAVVFGTNAPISVDSLSADSTTNQIRQRQTIDNFIDSRASGGTSLRRPRNFNLFLLFRGGIFA